MARSVSYGVSQVLNTFFSARWNDPTSITNFLSKLIQNVHKSPTTPEWEAGSEHYWHSRLPRVSVSGFWWSLCITSHCHQESLFPITMLFLMLSHSPPPSFLVAPPVPRSAPLGWWRRSPLTWSVTRLKTQQFLRELYRNNIYMLRWHHIISFGCMYILFYWQIYQTQF